MGNLLSNKIKSTSKFKKRNNFVEPASIITTSKELTNSANSSDLSRDFEQKQKVLKASTTSQEQKTASKPPVPRMSSKFLDDLRKKGSCSNLVMEHVAAEKKRLV